MFLQFILSLFIGSTNAYSKDIPELRKNIYQYSLEVGRTSDGFQGYFYLKKDGEIVHEERDYGSYFYVKSMDVNADGRRELIVTQWTGGGHCCLNLTIFELKKEITKLIHIEGGSRDFELTDVDEDNNIEIVFWDNPIDYVLSSFASSAQGKVIFKFQNGRFQLARSLMRENAPNSKELRMKKMKIKKEFSDRGELPHTFLELMMALSYSGHFHLAMTLAEELWPLARPGLADFKLNFSRSLSYSEYWRRFYLGP